MTGVVSIVYYTATLGVVTYCGQAYGPDLIGVAFIGGECGDIIRITDLDGTVHKFPKTDSGAFGHHCVRQLDGSCPPIAVDVPEQLRWFDGLSTLGTVRNISEERRAEEARQ